jgi:hypothetical protein
MCDGDSLRIVISGLAGESPVREEQMSGRETENGQTRPRPPEVLKAEKALLNKANG